MTYGSTAAAQPVPRTSARLSLLALAALGLTAFAYTANNSFGAVVQKQSTADEEAMAAGGTELLSRNVKAEHYANQKLLQQKAREAGGEWADRHPDVPYQGNPLYNSEASLVTSRQESVGAPVHEGAPADGAFETGGTLNPDGTPMLASTQKLALPSTEKFPIGVAMLALGYVAYSGVVGATVYAAPTVIAVAAHHIRSKRAEKELDGVFPDGAFALLGGQTGKFCAAEGDKIVCNRDTIGEWEQFHIEADGNKYNIKAHSGYCRDNKDQVVCDQDRAGVGRRALGELDLADGDKGRRGGGGGGGRRAERKEARVERKEAREEAREERDGSTKFKLTIVNKEERIVALQGRSGGGWKYCADEGEAGIKCDRDSPGAWEQFMVIDATPQNCQGDYGPFTACSAKCGGGTKESAYHISQPAFAGDEHKTAQCSRCTLL